jgi:hypothetical protein
VYCSVLSRKTRHLRRSYSLERQASVGTAEGMNNYEIEKTRLLLNTMERIGLARAGRKDS